MTLANRILPLLPALRQFGQMLTGAPDQVDLIIRRCLQQLVDTPLPFIEQNNAKLGLFRLFVTEVNSHFKETDPIETKDALGGFVDEFLAGLTFVERQTFLLRNIEEFSCRESAQIMGVAKEDVTALERRISRKLTHLS